MFGVSGTALGAILRAKRYSYKEISIVALIYAIIVLLIALVSLIFGQTTLSAILTFLPISITEAITLTGLTLAFIGGILAGIAGFAALILGAVVYDAAEAIIKSIK